MEARALFFVAALTEPTRQDLDRFFDDFILFSASGISGFDEAAHEK
jgi:hypothetical protein